MKTPSNNRVVTTRILIVAAFLGFLEVGPRVGWIDPLITPPLSKILMQFFEDFAGGGIVPDLMASLAAIACAFLLALVTGMLGGFLLWKYGLLRRIANPYLISYYSLPIFVFYPLLIGIFGLTFWPPVILAWGYSTVAIATNVEIGLSGVSTVFLKTAKVYQLTQRETFWRVQLPAAIPQILTGARLGATYAIIGIIACEFILSTKGLGHRVSFDYASFKLAQMYSTILTVFLLATVITALVSSLRRLVEGRVGN